MFSNCIFSSPDFSREHSGVDTVDTGHSLLRVSSLTNKFNQVSWNPYVHNLIPEPLVQTLAFVPVTRRFAQFVDDEGVGPNATGLEPSEGDLNL